MNLILNVIGAFIAGLLGHFTRPIMVREFTNGGRDYGGWFMLISCTIGVALAYPFVDAVHATLEDIEDRRTRLGAAYFLAFLGMGAGTALGHWILPDRKIGPR